MSVVTWENSRYVSFVSNTKIYVHEINGNTIYNREYYDYVLVDDWTKIYIIYRKTGKCIDVLQTCTDIKKGHMDTLTVD